jgi:very-short-patch-repair endonuclease
MSIELKKLTQNDIDAITSILASQTYPRTVKEIRTKLKLTGRHIPEYLLTRSLRELLSDGKVRFKAGRWINNEISNNINTPPTGFTPIRMPDLSRHSREIINITNLESPGDTEKPIERSGKWDTFRSLLKYYEECLRNEEGADASAFIEEVGKRYLFVNGIGSWGPNTGDSWNYIIPMGAHIHDFQKQLSKSLENIVILGYPIEAVSISRDGQPDTRLIRPVFQYILNQEFSNNSIKLSTDDAQPEISLEWLKYSLKNYSEQHHFLKHCGLINPRQSDDMPIGFSNEDIRPNLNELTVRLASFMPKNIIEALNCRSVNSNPLPREFKTGIYNKAVIMIGNRTTYTQTLIKELRYIQLMSDKVLEQTSLKYLFKNNQNTKSSEQSEPIIHERNVADAIMLNAEQRESIFSLMTNELSVVTGPPGTGKSQVVAGAIANMRLNNESVLFSSRNHKAIDAVVNRLKDNENNPLIIRCNSKEDNTINYNFKKAIEDILTRTIDIAKKQSYNSKIKQFKKLLEKRGLVAEKLYDIRQLRDKLGENEEKISGLKEELTEDVIKNLESLISSISEKDAKILGRLTGNLREGFQNQASNNLIHNFIFWFKTVSDWITIRNLLDTLFLGLLEPIIPPLKYSKLTEIDLIELEQIGQFIKCKRECTPLEESLKGMGKYDDLIKSVKNLSEKIESQTMALITLHSNTHGGLPHNSDDREDLVALKNALKALNNSFDSQAHYNEAIKRLKKFTPLVLDNFPSWAVTNLSVGTQNRIPLAPGIFDLAIIDEASQCDIASAIPVLFRSKRAAVVGDPKQLQHVSKMPYDKDSLLRIRAGLTNLDDLRFSYRDTSLFDLFTQSKTISPHLLRDTFRSCSEIADYSNKISYNGMLRVATNEKNLKTPKGIKPGIHWTEIISDVVSAGRSGCVAEDEIDAIYKLVEKILVNNNFKGTLGVVTPFRQQQKRIQDRIFDGALPHNLLVQSDLIIDTAHGFQGDEKDVMIFSLCGGPNMPRGSLHFLRESKNVFNVAVSRARAVLHIVGNRDWASRSGINHLVQLSKSKNEKKQEIVLGQWSPHESPWEQVFYEALLKKNIETIPQYPVVGRRLDLAYVDKKRNLKIDIEVDSDRFHRNPDGSRKRDDTWRDIQLMGLGWEVKRFWVYRLREDMDKCVSEIKKLVR